MLWIHADYTKVISGQGSSSDTLTVSEYLDLVVNSETASVENFFIIYIKVLLVPPRIKKLSVLSKKSQCEIGEHNKLTLFWH